MTRWLTKTGVAIAAAVTVLFWPAAMHAAKGNPMRILLVVDSSSQTEKMINDFRAGINAFIDAVPEDAEMSIITTGRQMRIRTPVTLDRAKLHQGANSYSSDGGGNVFVDALIEADSRFLKKAADKWSVIVLVITDTGESREEFRIDDYNKFATDFRARGGMAHAIVVKGPNAAALTNIASHLASNGSGTFEPINLSRLVPEKMKAVGERIAAAYKPFQQ